MSKPLPFLLLACLACAPQSVDRVAPGASPVGGGGGNGGMGGNGGLEGGTPAGNGGMAGSPVQVVDAAALDRSSDPPGVETPPPISPRDAAPDRAPDLAPPDLAPQIRVAQLVVGSTATLLPGDSAIRTLLLARNFQVVLRDDSQPAQVAGVQLVIIAGSAEEINVANAYRNVPVPVICLEFPLFDNLGMTGGTENTNFGLQVATQINILDATHPLAAGLSGVVTVTSASANFSWGLPGPAAARIATIPGQANRATIFAYATGAPMLGLAAAPAKRIGFFALDSSATQLTSNGIRLFTAAIEWAIQAD